MNTQELYGKGFNNGYILAKYEPSLLAQVIQNVLRKNEYILGLISGKEEYEIEIIQGRVNELSQLRIEKINKENNLEREDL